MAAGSSNPTTNLKKVANTPVDVNTGNASSGTQRVVLASNQPIIPTTTTQASTALAGVTITGTAGQFSCTAFPLSVGMLLTITGTIGGTGSIEASTTGTVFNKAYRISATNGSTSFTLVLLDNTAIATTAGTPTGLTYTVNNAQFVTNISQFAGQTISMNTGVRDAGTLRVSVATNDVVQIGDNSGSLTVDAPVASPVFVRLSDGTAPITALPITDNNGNISIDDGGNSITVDGSVGITTVYDVGASAVAGAKLFLSGAIRQDTITDSTGGDGKYGNIKINNVGRLYTTGIIESIVAGNNIIGKVKLTDDAGGNIATIKAGNTAPVNLDTALVVALHPTYSLPTGLNTIGKLAANAGVTIGAVEIATGQTLNTVSTVTTVTNLTQLSGQNIAMNAGTRNQGTQRVTIATDDVLTVSQSTSALNSVTINSAVGEFVCAATTSLFLGQLVTVTGTFSVGAGQGAITGYNSPTIYKIGTTNGSTTFTLLRLDNTAISTTAGTTSGLTFTVQNQQQIANLSQIGGVNVAMGTGVRTLGTQRVTVATDDVISVSLGQVGANTNATTTAYANSLVVKNTAGTLYMLTGFNSLNAAQWIHLHNSTTVPSTNSIPAITFYVAPLSNFSFDFGIYGRSFSTGIVVTNSTTGPTLTIGLANCWFDTQYK